MLLAASIRSPVDGPLRFTALVRFGFDFHWLRQPTPAKIAHDLGLSLDSDAQAGLEILVVGSFLGELSSDWPGWSRLRIFKRSECASWISVRAQASLSDHSGQLAETILRLARFEDETRAFRLAGFIHQKALAVLENKCCAELSRRCEAAASDSPLFDCSFDSSPEGQTACRKALTGDFSELPSGANAHVRRHPAIFTHQLSHHARIELHLPFLSPKGWRTRAEVLEKLQADPAEDLRLLLHTTDSLSPARKRNAYQTTLAVSPAFLQATCPGANSNFTLAFADRRRLFRVQARPALAAALRGYGFDSQVERWLDANSNPGAHDLDVAVTLAVPGELASAWCHAPLESDPRFFPVFSTLSVALQGTMRRWLPYLYFSELDRYDNPTTAYPLLVYPFIRPSAGEPRFEFTRDLLEFQSPRLSRRSTVKQLASTLKLTREFLLAAGKEETARFYCPDRAGPILARLQRQPRYLNALLAAETYLVDTFVRMGTQTRELTNRLAREPQTAARDFAAFAEDIGGAFHRKLRRLYNGRGFLSLGSLLLVEATRALSEALGTPAAISAVLHLTIGERDQPGCIEHTFVNSAFQP